MADRGPKNRGVFARELAAANIGLEAPYQLGKVERHGDMWKTVASKVIESKSIKGTRAMATMATEANAVMNGMGRAGGFAPSQWVLGRVPRRSAGEQGDDELAGQVGSLEERVDPTTIFAERMSIRHAAKR